MNGLNSFIAAHQLPLDVLTTLINPLLKDICPATDFSSIDAAKYMDSIRQLVKDLPPVITRYI